MPGSKFERPKVGLQSDTERVVTLARRADPMDGWSNGELQEVFLNPEITGYPASPWLVYAPIVTGL